MRIKYLIGLLAIVFSINCSAKVETAGPFTKSNNKLEWMGVGEKLCIEPFGNDALRFRSSKSLHIVDQDWNLIRPKYNSNCKITISDKKAIITNGFISAEVNSKGRITYYNGKGKLLLKEISYPDSRYNREYITKGSNSFKIQVTFESNENEKFYGMGQYANGYLDLKGTILDLTQENGQISIPFLLSTRGYGLIWNNPSVGRAELVSNHTRFVADLAKQLDYVMISEPTIAKIERKYTDITGKAPVMPYYATGFWQSKLRYSTQDELMGVAKEYKKRNLPISVIVEDFYHWPVSGDWKFDEKYWPNPEEMVKELNAMDIKLSVSVWPTIVRECENYKTMRNNNYLINVEKGSSVLLEDNELLTYVDVTNPDARKYLWSKVKENYYDKGVRMFWLDQAEPGINTEYAKNLRYYQGNGLEMTNIYPYYFSKTFFDGQKAAGQKDIVNLVRSGWIGSQTLGAVLWSGDINGDYDTFRKQIKAGLNISLCGIPWWNTDIGGFYGHPNQVYYNELLIRWFQYGAFCPVMRLHGHNSPGHKIKGQVKGSGEPNEVWSFGDDAYKILSHYLNVREKLRPYIYVQMKNASKTGDPVMRPMFYDFPDDENTYNYDYQYMFGPDLLVAPVIKAGVKEKVVYLPKGAKWTDARNGKSYVGGQEIIVKVDLNDIPVFCKNSFKFNLKDN